MLTKDSNSKKLLLASKTLEDITLIELFDAIAKLYDKDIDEAKTRYDRKYLRTSKSIMDAIFLGLAKRGLKRSEIKRVWEKYGPITDKNLNEGEVIVDSRFFICDV
jgi:hypothetical protein